MTSKSVRKKSWLQAVLKLCINFSGLEHIPLCVIYRFKFSLGVRSWELFFYKKQNMIFFSWEEFLSISVRCSAEEAAVWLPEIWTYIRSHVSFFSEWPHCYTVPRLLFPSSLQKKSVSMKGVSRIHDGIFCQEWEICALLLVPGTACVLCINCFVWRMWNLIHKSSFPVSCIIIWLFGAQEWDTSGCI